MLPNFHVLTYLGLGGKIQNSEIPSPDAEQGPGFMHLDITHGTVFVGLQVTDDAGFTD